MTTLSPISYWAQTHGVVSLKIDLKDVKDPYFKCDEKEIHFTGKGVGAHGFNDYSFKINLYDNVDPNADSTTCKVFDSKVEIFLKKSKLSWWPRLTAQPQKPVWLKVDFERWKSEEGDSEEEGRDIMDDYPGMYDELYKQELGYRKENMRKVYLLMYNLLQFVCFMYILAVMSVRYFKYGKDSMRSTYEYVGGAMKFAQFLQFLEILHPIFKYTKGSYFEPLLQVSGRAFIVYVMIDAEPRIQTLPVVFYLFLVWSTIEIVRYPYYITQVYKKDIYILTWLRYTLWIPLYPLGVFCEGIIIFRNIPYFEETTRFSIELPNVWNFSFYLPSVMRMYLILLFFPGLFAMMNHMSVVRRKKIGVPKKARKMKEGE